MRNGNITGYTIGVNSLDTNMEEPQLLSTSLLVITIDGLDPHTHYVCIIAANTAIGMGPFSPGITIQTETDGSYIYNIA